MDISIKCQLSLSKKLRALIPEGETRITLVATSITDGRGEAKLIISSDSKINKNTTDFLGKETSIMFVPTEIEEITVNNDSVGSIFSRNPTKTTKTTPTNKNTKNRQSIERIAAEEPPEDDGDEAFSIKTQEEIEEETPEVFKEVKNPSYRKYVSTIEDLEVAVKAARNKVSDIDVDSIQDARKRLVAMEIKEKSESIDVDAFIVNDKCANLAINDLGINLMLNAPFNLANISAKRINNSKDLKAMFDIGYVRFINPKEIGSYVKKAEASIGKPTLDVYSSYEEAGEHMERNGMSVDRIDMDMRDLEGPTDSEILITNLTGAPSRPSVRSSGTTRTVHGNQNSRPSRLTQQNQEENSKGIKPIRKL